MNSYPSDVNFEALAVVTFDDGQKPKTFPLANSLTMRLLTPLLEVYGEKKESIVTIYHHTRNGGTFEIPVNDETFSIYAQRFANVDDVKISIKRAL